MKKKTMTLLLCGITGVLFAQKKADFAGRYLIDNEKTQLGSAHASVLPKSIKLTQSKDSIFIERTTIEDKPQVIEKLPFDGKPQNRDVGGGKSVSILKWSEDGKSIIVDKDIKYDDGDSMKYHDTWALEENGKVLTLMRDVQSGAGAKYSVKGVYNKK